MAASNTITKGFRLTHVGLRVTDLEKSLVFYTGVFGMKELYRLPLDTVTVVFLGYKSESSTAPDDTPLFAREGVLELVCPTNQVKPVSDEHPVEYRSVKLALGVPDMAAAMRHFKSCGVKVVKDVGTKVGSEVMRSFLGCAREEEGFDGLLWGQVESVAFLEDPDGWLIEVIPY